MGDNRLKMRILRVDASARPAGEAYSRRLGERLLARLIEYYPQAEVMHRDLSNGVPLLTAAELAARDTPAFERTAQQQLQLATSTTLAQELAAAESLLLTTPIYNFSVPGALKAYIDQVCCPDLTFRYTDAGPEGLLSCRAYLVVTSAGTPIDSAVDFAVPYLRHVLGFMGVDDITVAGCDRIWHNPEERFQQAIAAIDQLDLS